jgi:hypothetical protein
MSTKWDKRWLSTLDWIGVSPINEKMCSKFANKCQTTIKMTRIDKWSVDRPQQFRAAMKW